MYRTECTDIQVRLQMQKIVEVMRPQTAVIQSFNFQGKHPFKQNDTIDQRN